MDVLELICEGLQKKIPYGKIFMTEGMGGDYGNVLVCEVRSSDRGERSEWISASQVAIEDLGHETSRIRNEANRVWFTINVQGMEKANPMEAAKEALQVMGRYYSNMFDVTDTEDYIVLDGIRVYPSVFKSEYEKLIQIKETIRRKSLTMKS